MSHEKERSELNQLARETLLLNTEIETAERKFQLRIDKLKTRAKELWKQIDDSLD